MEQKIETRFAADKLALKLRWFFLLAAGLLVSDQFQNPILIGIFAAAVVANLFGHRFSKAEATYLKTGKNYLEFLRYADGLILIGSSFFPAFRSSNLWLMAVPLVLAQALVCRRTTPVLLLSGILLVLQALAGYSNKNVFQSLILPASCLGGSAIAGLCLATFRTREELLLLRDHRLAALLECGSELAASYDLKSTILNTLKAAVTETQASCGYVMLFNDDSHKTLTTEVAYSTDGEFEFPTDLEAGSGISGYVAKMGQPIAVSSSSEEHQQFDGFTSGVRSAACVPLVTRAYAGAGQANIEQVLGVMTLLDLNESDSFKADDMELLRTLGALIAVGVASAKMEERRRTTFLLTLESLATALEARDEYTRGHSQRVCELSLMIGEKMGFGVDAIEELRVGTILHDIGKIGVPDEILNKRSRLTDEEFEVMKSHPVIGYEICRPLMLSEGVLMIIRNHHEKLDGSGYPDGLKGGELPLSLRIVCVADAFDAMSSRRPYRAVMETSTVLAELSKGAGTQFDPVVVEVLKDLMQSERLHDLYLQYWGPREQKAA